MAGSSLLRGFVSLFFLLFLHIGNAGCCFSTGSSAQTVDEDDAAPHGVGGGGNKRRKISPLAFSPSVSSSTVAADARASARRRRQASSLATSFRFYLHRIFSYSSGGAKNGAAAVPSTEEAYDDPVTTTVSSPLAHSSSLPPHQRQAAASVVLSTPSSPSCASSPFLSPLSPRSLSVTPVATVPSSPRSKQVPRQSSSRSFAVFPCKVCGEVMSKPQQLELHQAMKHSLSELSTLDSSMNIIRMIFLAGWNPSTPAGEPPSVRRILRIHHNPRALARFEEYRDLVRARAARGRCASAAEERCVADGNERLRFYCSTMLCALGGAGGVCGSPYCCTCSILRHGFAGKQADVDGIATYSSGRAAHASLPDDVEREFAFLQVRRTMLVCRVVAGRVGRGAADDKDVAYDSMVPLLPAASSAAAAAGRGGDDDVELLVFNPRAVLPCFVIIYSC
uniref:C2H2-type domain-containing protein n=1 Tax=Leersia perrieri TaxID=77586 RepID=A0A0D9VS92_9ORYZ